MNANEQLRRFEEINQRVGTRSEQAQREKIALDYDKQALKEKMDALKAKGISFNNVTELKDVLEDRVSQLANVLDATERKLNETT